MKQLLSFCILFLNIKLSAETIKVGVSESVPFYISNLDAGIQIDHIRAAFKLTGNINVKSHSAGLNRNIQEYRFKRIDCVAPVPNNGNLSGYYSTEFVTEYQNAAIFRKDRNITFDSWNDFAGKRVVSFQNATKWLGGKFENTTKAMRWYEELSQIENMSLMVHSGRVDAAIIDVNIFKYFLVKRNLDLSKIGYAYKFFKPARFFIVCHKKKHRDMVNTGLMQIKLNGKYKSIIDKYTTDLDVNKVY